MPARAALPSMLLSCLLLAAHALADTQAQHQLPAPQPPEHLALLTPAAWSNRRNLALQVGDSAPPDFAEHSPVVARYDRAKTAEELQRADGRTEIRLQQAWFDPLQETPPLPPALAGSSRGDGPYDYFIVQFHGPIRPEWRRALAAAGHEVLDYVPDFALLVRATGPGARELEQLDVVRWVGSFAPAYRLSNELAETALRADDEELEVRVRAFPGEPLSALLEALGEISARLNHSSADSGGGAILRLTLPATRLIDLAHVRAVAWIEPVHELAFANAVARGNGILGAERVGTQLGLFGQGQVAAVTDSGLSTGNVNTMHLDFQGRVIGAGWGPGNCGTWADQNAHGTHVAGSVLGSGVRSGASPGQGQYAGSEAGTAPQAELVVWSACNDFSGIPDSPYQEFWGALHSFHANLRVNNNSWGITSPSAFGTYNTFARETDRFIFDFPDMVGVFSAMNEGRDANQDGVSDFGTILPASTAKNVIAVGASENLRLTGGFNPGGACSTWGTCWPQDFPAEPISSDRISDKIDGMAPFSGRGPTLSNRLKPDIVAPGTNILSARNESHQMGSWGPHDAYYHYMGGTSMASPLVAGGALLVRDYFARLFSYTTPSAALVKAVLINGARDMSPGQYGVGPTQDVWRRPDINQGWGRMDLVGSLIFEQGRVPAYFDITPGVQTGQTGELEFEVDAGGELRVTLVWSDRAGLEASHGALVNDLDLELVDPNGVTHFGSAGLVGVQRDRFNNFEEVHLDNAPSGGYTLRVRSHNVPMGPQPFALVISGRLATPDDAIFRDRFQP